MHKFSVNFTNYVNLVEKNKKPTVLKQYKYTKNKSYIYLTFLLKCYTNNSKFNSI